MENENMVASPNEAEVVAPDATEVAEVTDVDWKSEAEKERQARLKAEEVAKNQKIRAEKAEKAAKTVPETKSVDAKNPELSYKDIVALQNAKVSEDDFEEVRDYARFKGVSIADALKTDTLKATLNLRSEQRNTANATNVGAVRRGAAKISDEALLDNAAKGNLPDSDEEIERLMRVKMGFKK